MKDVEAGPTGVVRCVWPRTELDIAYHDREWGVPLHDDQRHFEFIVLDGAQAGLSWSTILNKRESYRRAFDGFDPAKVARYGQRKLDALLADPGLVRNRLKMTAAVSNARAFLKVQEEHGGFDAYIWRFVGGQPRQNVWRALVEIPAATPESEAMSKDLRQRGFRFVGPTICYAYMQAAGMVNDHTVDCFRHAELGGVGKGGRRAVSSHAAPARAAAPRGSVAAAGRARRKRSEDGHGQA